jgi:hypothetical protein
VTAWAFLGWVAAGSLALVIATVALLIVVGVVKQLGKPLPERRTTVGARRVSPGE